MPIDWTAFADLVGRNDRFLLTTHVRPDADGLGSKLALAETLEAMGKHVQLVIASVFPKRYDFMDPQRRIKRFSPPGDEYRDVQVAIVLDTGTWNQLGDFGPFLKDLSAAKVVIDHHVSQDPIADLQLVDTSAEATGRLVFEAINALQTPLSASAANYLFVALAMDTGWFRHKNTTPKTFALAEKLVASGAQPTASYDELFELNSLGRLKLMGLVLSRLQVVHDGRIAFTEVHRSDYEATGALPQDTEDLVNFARSVDGAQVGLILMEQPAGGIKVSFRSQSADVAKVAEQFGGGGHKLAAGAILDTTLDDAREKVLNAVSAQMP